MSAFSLIIILLAALATLGLGAALLQILHLKHLPPSLTVGVGYGLGVVAIGKALLWASYANLPLGVASWVMVAIGITAGIWVFYGQFLQINSARFNSGEQSASLRPIPTRAPHRDPIIVGLVLLMVAHLCITLGNNLTRPIFPWDAFTTWMYRAKAWALQDAITPMATVPDWIAEGGTVGYALYASHYPAALSIYAAFASSLAGGWHSMAASAPWTLCLLALCLTAHGTMVLGGFSQRIATIGAYLLCSLPLLNIHSALAGYGDLWMALFSGGGLALLLVWRQARLRRGLWVALLLLLAGTQIKTEGWLWLILGLAFLSLEWIARRIGYRWLFAGSAFIGLAAWETGFTYISLGPFGQWGLGETHLHAGALGDFALRPFNPLMNYFSVFFKQANFLLLASVYPLALLVMLMAAPKQAAPLWLMALLIALTQAAIFALSSYSLYAETGTAISRLLIHFTPIAIFTIATALQTIAMTMRSGDLPSDSAETALNSGPSRSPWTPLISALILALALLSPAVPLLTKFDPQGERQDLAFNANDFTAVVGRIITSNQGLKFIDSPINVGVLSAPLKQSHQTLPRYLKMDVSLEEPRDAAFYWILEGETDVQKISISSSGEIIEDMYRYPKWRGEKIKEIGYLVQASALHTTTIRRLSLRASLGLPDLKTLLSQWLTVEDTSQRLINNTLGHADSPISRNGWLSISFITALFIVCWTTLWLFKSWGAQPAVKMALSLWVFSDLTSFVASEPLNSVFQSRGQQLAAKNPTEKVLIGAAAVAAERLTNASPIMIIATDVKSEFIAQKLPFTLLPNTAAHVDAYKARGISAAWSGAIFIVGDDKQELSRIAAEIAPESFGMKLEQHDGFMLLQAAAL